MHSLHLATQSAEPEWIERNNQYNLQEMYDFISCRTIEIIRLHGLVIDTPDGGHIESPLMVLDEEGKLTGKEINPIATSLMRACGFNDFAVGNVIVCDGGLIN
jgi:hypothetical protein